MARPQQTDNYYFEGFSSPNTTPVPDVVFDRLLGRLKEAELKALLYIIRRTFGFKRGSDSISFNQFLRGITTRDGRVLDEGCGVKDRTTLSNALKSLEKKGIVVSTKGMDERGENQTTVYALRFKPGDPMSENEVPTEIPPRVVGNSYHPGRDYPPPVVGNSYPQETGRQQTEISDSNIRKSTRSNDDFVDNSPSYPITLEANRSVSRNGSETHHAVEGIGSIMARLGPEREAAQPVKRQRGRPRKFQDQESQTLLNYVSDFAREFSDKATLNQSATRMINLYHRWGRGDIDAFVGVLYQARSVTKAQNNIRTSKFAYFCSVVEDLLGLREEATTVSSRTS